MKIEFKGGKIGLLESKAIVVADDYEMIDNKISIPIKELTGEVPFEQLQVVIDDSPITFTYIDDGLSRELVIEFSDKKHIDFINGLIKMNNMKNKIGKLFKF